MLTADLRHRETTEDQPHRQVRRLPLTVAIIFTALAQGLLAAAIALGGNPLVGIAAATMVALCGFLLVTAAGLQN